MAQRQQREPSGEWELVAASDVHIVDALKREGNTLFQQQQFFDAIQTYGRALSHVTSIDVEALTHDDGESLKQLEAAVRLNRALAYIEIEDANLLAYADEDCSIVLARQPHCVKAFYRRALARERLGKIKDALLDVEQMCALEPANPAALQLLARLQLAWSNDCVQQWTAESELSAALKQQCLLSTQTVSRNNAEEASARTSALDAWMALQVEEQRLRDEIFKQSVNTKRASKVRPTTSSNKKDGANLRQTDRGKRAESCGDNVRSKTESLWAALMHEETTTVERIYKTKVGAAMHNATMGKLKTPSAASIHPSH